LDIVLEKMTARDGFDTVEDFHIISKYKKFGILENGRGRVFTYKANRSEAKLHLVVHLRRE